MSVLKNKRRTSKIEYERNFIGIYEYMMNLLDHMPKRYAGILGRPMKERLTLHPKKTCIVKLTKGVTFLKVRYRFDGNRTVKTLHKSGIVRMRRKLRKFSNIVKGKKMKLDDVYASVQSWITHARTAKSYRAVCSMLRKYDDLFDGHRITRRYWKNNKALKRKRKVAVV